MLRRARDAYFVVYPSWADLGLRWEDLGRVLSDPAAGGGPGAGRDWKRLGYPDAVQPFRLIDGPVGGGVIEVHAAPTEKWLPGALLSREADIAIPPGTAPVAWGAGDLPQVYYLEPRDGPMAGVPFGPAFLKRRAKLYRCGVTVEHAGAAGESVYWALGVARGRKAVEGVADLGAWARSFDLEVRRLDRPPEALSAEAASRFADPAHEPLWYVVDSVERRVGFHFAAVVYLAYHLRRVGGARVVSMHLVAAVEGGAYPGPP